MCFTHGIRALRSLVLWGSSEFDVGTSLVGKNIGNYKNRHETLILIFICMCAVRVVVNTVQVNSEIYGKHKQMSTILNTNKRTYTSK